MITMNAYGKQRPIRRIEHGWPDRRRRDRWTDFLESDWTGRTPRQCYARRMIERGDTDK